MNTVRATALCAIALAAIGRGDIYLDTAPPCEIGID